jgi:signal transduction histidine kinase
LDHLDIDKEALKRILDFLPYPFLVSETRQGKRYNVFVNQKFLDEIGYTCEEMPTNDDWFTIAYPDPAYRKKIKSEWNNRSAQAIDTGEDSVFLQAFVHTKKFGDRWYEVKSSLSGQIHLVAFVDIHEVMVREQELQRMNLNKDKVLSVLGHDLRGPITNLQSITTLMLAGNLSREEFSSMVKTVNEKVFQSMEFLDTTLLWTKSNFDKISILIEKLTPMTLVDHILPIYQNQYESKKITVTVDIPADAYIYSDSEILTIIIRNLLSNAIKFTNENGTVHISARQQDELFVLSIKDSGIGMDAKTISLIWEDNYYSSRGTRSEIGTGLGLRLCKELLKQIGGTLDIESKKNVGTTMKIKLKNNLPDY